MKNLLPFLLLLFAGSTFAFGDKIYNIDEGNTQGQAQGQGQLQGQLQGQAQGLVNKQDLDANAKALSGSVSDSNAKAYSGSTSLSKSSGEAQADAQAQNHGDQLTSIVTQFEAVSASAAALDLPYCGEGVSGQGDEGGVGMANTNFVCESQMALKMSLLLVDMELASAAHYESKDNLDLRDVHLVKAHGHMLSAEGIIDEVVDYIEDRSDTASLAATTKDLAWPTLLIGLLVLAL